MRTQEIVAANVRARLAWTRMTTDDALHVVQCSARSFRYKLAGVYPFRPDELDRLAPYLGIDDVAELFRVPAGFTAPPAAPAAPKRSRAIAGSSSACTPLAQVSARLRLVA